MIERKNVRISRVLVWLFLVIWAVIVLFPFYWMVLTSVKNTALYNNEKIPEFFTAEPTGENYVKAFTEVSLGRYFVNTLIFTAATTGLMMLVIVSAAFAFSRLEFKGKNLLFALFLSLMMIPNELVIITHDLDNLMIFFANHDHDRTGDVLRHDPARMRLALALLATLRGIPQLYYGDEMMFCEKPGLHHDGSKRIDFPGGWEGDPVNLFTPEGRAAAGYTRDADYTAAEGLHDYARALFRWRKGCPVIHHGKTLHFLSRKNVDAVNYTDNTYSYFRYDDQNAVFVYINNTDQVRELDWSHYDEFVVDPVTGRDVISGEPVTLADGLPVEPRTALIVEFKR